MLANPSSVTEMSDLDGALARGPESSYVIAAVGAVLDGDGRSGLDHLLDGARATSWTGVVHRLDVAGRALALDAGLRPADVPAVVAHVAALAAGAGVDPLPGGVVEVLRAWSAGEGIPVAVDLQRQRVDLAPDSSRAWAACLVLGWLVERSGFPPEVVA